MKAVRASALPAAISVLGAEPVTNNGAPDEATSRPKAPGAAAAAAGVKREGAGVKRERGPDSGDDDEPAVPRSATAAERVDLTEEVSGLCDRQSLLNKHCSSLLILPHDSVPAC